MSIINVNPKLTKIQNPNPHGSVQNPNPKLDPLKTPNFVYLETRTILKGQPLPWGINWAITYPATITFIATRL